MSTGQNHPSVWSWLCGCAAGVPILAISFYVLFHLGLGLSLHQLLAPWLIQSALTMLLAPFFYWSRRRRAISEGDVRPMALTIYAYGVLGSLLYLWYGFKFRLISQKAASEAAITLVLATPALYLITVYTYRKFLSKP